MASQILNSLQSRAVQKIGDVYCPKADAFPKFSDLGAIEHIDILLAEIPPQDLSDLKLLLSILGVMPGFIIYLVVALIENGKDLGGPIGSLLRMIRFGFRGIIFSLYYSSLQASELVGYQIQMKI